MIRINIILESSRTFSLRFLTNIALWRIARQRLAKHVPEHYAVNENRRPLLDNGFGYHGSTGVSGTCKHEQQ
jgi:hypothetical protein